jgi:dihydrodipicolinate synthase/N-acetylneuraminate lyase
MRDLSIVLPVVTPCSRAGQADLAGMQSVCRAMVDAGCTSIFVAGSTGRGPWFNRDERSRMCRAAADSIGDRATLLAGCMASGLSDMLENARSAAAAGAQVAVVTAPGYFNYNVQEIEAIFTRFADASPLPVMIYDIPGFARVKLDGQMLVRLSRHGNIIGFKDSTEDFERFQWLLSAAVPCFRKGEVHDRAGFLLLQGKERLLADSLRRGASGFVVSLLHIDPRPFVALSQAVRAGRDEEADRYQEAIKHLLDLIEGCFARRPETSTFFHLLNWALKHHGICENILLDHEGECPDWLADAGRQALDICRAAASPVD